MHIENAQKSMVSHGHITDIFKDFIADSDFLDKHIGFL